MPEYLAPGVYVEETSFRSKSIEGVSTTTTGFVGPTLYGPVADEPEILTSLADFERTYGPGNQLAFAERDATMDPDSLELPESRPATNHIWHAVNAFFNNGGKRLYVKRIYREIPFEPVPGDPDADTSYGGFASATVGRGGATDPGLIVRARFPGAAGARRIRLTLELGQSILAREETTEGGVTIVHSRVRGLADRDVVLIERSSGSPMEVDADFAIALQVEAADGSRTWRFEAPEFGPDSPPATGADSLTLDELDPETDRVSIVTLAVTDLPTGDAGLGMSWLGLPLDADHERGGVGDSLFDRFSENPARRSDRVELPVVIERSANDLAGLGILQAIFDHDERVAGASPPDLTLRGRLLSGTATDDQRSVEVRLEGGSDGLRPRASDYEGRADPNEPFKYGLKALEDLEDISIVAAPGSSDGYENGYKADAAAVIQALVGHAERMRYRIAVLDSGDGQRISQVRAMRSVLDSKYAALYYPWVVILDPITQREVALPPSGFVAGIYARNDVERAVYKAPANEVVTGALRFETMLNKAQQEVLNPAGINCFRFFEGRGNRLWGARTISSDPEWKYVNLRRYFAYLERSIDIGTQWAVFEPNGELLWGNVRRTISDFLLNEFQMGALLGDKPEKAFFVKCDRSTMTQNDIDNGRLVCLIGVAPLRPAEFVIFRIGQWTADRKV
jgi:phage tail sheath protein FI